MTQNYRQESAAFLDQHSEPSLPSIDKILNPPSSTAPARHLMEIVQWLVIQLGIEQGQISVCLHQNQPTKVGYGVCETYEAFQRKCFDELSARAEFEEAERILRESGRRLHPHQACDCIHAILSPVLRGSTEEYGDLTINVCRSRAALLRPAPVIRFGTPHAEEQVYEFLFRRKQ